MEKTTYKQLKRPDGSITRSAGTNGGRDNYRVFWFPIGTSQDLNHSVKIIQTSFSLETLYIYYLGYLNLL